MCRDRRRFIAIAWLVAFVGGQDPLHARIPDLTERTPPPELGRTTYATVRAAELDQALTQLLIVQQPVDAREDLLLRVRINCHRIALEMLERADQAGAVQSEMILAALRLADGMAELVEVLEPVLSEARDPRVVEARAALARFNEVVSDRLARLVIDDPAGFESSLGECLQSLTDAVGVLEQASPAGQWLVDDSVDPPIETRTVQIRLGELKQQVAATSLGETARSIMERNLDYLQRGLTFEEFRPRIEGYLETLEDLMATARAIPSASWLEPSEATLYQARIERAAEWFGDPVRREEAIELVDRLSISRAVLGRITELQRHSIDLRPLAKALREAEALIENEQEGDDGRGRLDRLLKLLQPMQAYRELEHVEIPRDLRSLRRAMMESFERSERTIIGSLDEVLVDPMAFSDPATSGQIQLLWNVIADLERLDRTAGWIEAVGRMRARSERQCLRRIRIVAEWLVEPGRRDEAVALFDRFEIHVDRFETLPLEDEFREGSIELTPLTGGLGEQFFETIASTRSRWCEVIGSDLSGGEAGRHLERYDRLCRAMKTFTELSEVRDEALLLNRWAAWMLEPNVIERPMNELPLRFKLAVAAAVNDVEADLTDQLELIERELPLLKLVHAITKHRREELEALSRGPIGMLGALTVRPGPEAWLGEERQTLISLCRYAHEREHARAGGTSALVREIGDFVNRLSERIMSIVDDEPLKGPVDSPDEPVESPVHP